MSTSRFHRLHHRRRRCGWRLNFPRRFTIGNCVYVAGGNAAITPNTPRSPVGRRVSGEAVVQCRPRDRGAVSDLIRYDVNATHIAAPICKPYTRTHT